MTITTQAGNTTPAVDCAAYYGVTYALRVWAAALRYSAHNGRVTYSTVRQDLTTAERDQFDTIATSVWVGDISAPAVAARLDTILRRRHANATAQAETPEDRAATVDALLAAGREVMGDDDTVTLAELMAPEVDSPEADLAEDLATAEALGDVEAAREFRAELAAPAPAPRAVIVRNFRDMVTHDELAETAADLRAELTNARQASTVLAQRAEDQRVELETLRAQVAVLTVEVAEERAKLTDTRLKLHNVQSAARIHLADLAHRAEQLALTF